MFKYSTKIAESGEILDPSEIKKEKNYLNKHISIILHNWIHRICKVIAIRNWLYRTASKNKLNIRKEKYTCNCKRNSYRFINRLFCAVEHFAHCGKEFAEKNRNYWNHLNQQQIVLIEWNVFGVALIKCYRPNIQMSSLDRPAGKSSFIWNHIYKYLKISCRSHVNCNTTTIDEN